MLCHVEDTYGNPRRATESENVKEGVCQGVVFYVCLHRHVNENGDTWHECGGVG